MAATRQEAEVMERRLRPVYDAIDNGQNKKVLQLVEKILKKNPSMHCAKALKAIALLRLGRGEDGGELVNKIIQTKPGDSATLQAVFWYCREVGDYDKMVELYEGAARMYPNNEEILTQLFMAYVRVGDYQKQQQVALQLTKHFADNGPYYCWRVMSTLVLAHKTPEKQELLLTLAERLMDKFVADKKVDSEAEVRLYIMILRNLGKTEKCLEVVRGELGSKLRNKDEVITHELSCLHKLNKWEEIVAKIPPLLLVDPDQWTFTKMYISAQLRRSLAMREALVEEEKENREGEIGEEKRLSWQNPLRETRALLEKLLSGEGMKQPHRVCRSPHLGLLELAAQTDRHQLQTEDSQLLTQLQVYFEQFATKSCCFDDIKLFLNELSPEDTAKLFHSLEKSVSADSIDFDCSDEHVRENANKMCRLITLTQLQRFTGAHRSLSIKEKQETAKRFVKLWESGLWFGRSLPATVNQPSDFFIVVAAHLLIEVYGETNDPTYLWECIVVLEAARKQTRTNPDLQLLLWKLYAFLGPVEICTQLYNCLQVKHIQIDTIGYLIIRHIQSMGAFGFASQFYRMALRFYLGCPREAADFITTAYKNGVFHKIIEMVDLREQLSHSMGFYDICVRMLLQETVMMDLNSMEKVRNYFLGEKYHSSLPSDPPLNTEDFSKVLRDNRDLKVFEDWSPPDQLLRDDDSKQSFEAESLWIKVRVLIVQCLHELVTRATPDATPSKHTHSKGCECNGEVRDVFTKLEETLKQAVVHPGITTLKARKCELLPLQAPPPCQLELFLRHGYGSLLERLFRVATFLLQRTPDESCSVEQELREAMGSLKEVRNGITCFPSDVREVLKRAMSSSEENGPGNLEDTITYENHPFRTLLHLKMDIESYVLLLTVVSCVLVVCGVCVGHLKPSTSKKKKKHKAASSSVANPSEQQSSETECIGYFLTFLRDLQALLHSLAVDFSPLPVTEGEKEDRLVDAYVTGRSTEVSDDAPLAKHRAEVEGEVCRGVLRSYNTSFGDCIQVVKAKMAFTASLIKQLGGSSLLTEDMTKLD